MARSPQPRQRCAQPFDFGGLFGMVGARFFDGLRLCLFDKGWV
jgi:hypothetical protein